MSSNEQPPVVAPVRWRNPRHVWLAASALVLLVGSLAQFRYIGRGFAGEFYDSRFSQTTMVVREFVRKGFDWRTPLPVFGEHSMVPFEFPLFQGIAALVARVSGLTPETSTRLAGLLAFQAVAVLVWWLASRWFSRTSALAALVLFELLPFGMEYGHAALIDFLPVAIILAAVALLEPVATATSRWLVLTCSLAVVLLVPIGFLTKSTTGLALIPVLAIPGLMAKRSSRGIARQRTTLGVAGAAVALALVATSVWTRLTDDVKLQNKWASGLTSGALKNWNFGTLEQRHYFSTWEIIFNQHWATITAGVVVFLVAVGVSLVTWKFSSASVIVAVTPLLAPVIFTNLYLEHSYYSIAVYPLLVMLFGAAIGGACQAVPGLRERAAVAAISILVLLSLTWLSSEGGKYREVLSASVPVPPISTLVKATVPSGVTVLYLGCDWNPTYPYYADRPALMLPGWSALQPTADDLQGVGYAAFCAEPGGGYDATLERVLPRGFSWTAAGTGLFALQKGS